MEHVNDNAPGEIPDLETLLSKPELLPVERLLLHLFVVATTHPRFAHMTPERTYDAMTTGMQRIPISGRQDARRGFLQDARQHFRGETPAWYDAAIQAAGPAVPELPDSFIEQVAAKRMITLELRSIRADNVPALWALDTEGREYVYFPSRYLYPVGEGPRLLGES